MFARTERLFLRPAWPEDEAALFAAIGREEVVRNLGSAPWPFTREDARERIGKSLATPAGSGDCLIFLRTAGAPILVGGIGFGRWSDRHDVPELGYWITPAHQGKGIASEAARAALEVAFLAWSLPMLAAGHWIDNPASGRVLERLGFEPTGEVLPYPCRARGCDVDSVEYRLSRERWLELRTGFRKAA
jgi:RimJ/RimL family protein N-acetyltransferase